MKAYERVMASRAKGRLTAQDYIDGLIIDFMEFHGDRRYGDDKAIIGGIGKIKNMPITVITQAKGRYAKERGLRNSGSPHPEGYRKALRLMKQAEKFRRPILCLVDTSGAYPGIEAEKRGQGQAIAENLYEMSTLKTPVVTLFIGEGGSGGALALAVADKVIMMENAFYSVISPEGCASILWKNPKKKKEAAESLKLTADDMYKFEIAEHIIKEPADGNNRLLFRKLEDIIYDEFEKLSSMTDEKLLKNRYEKFRKIGRK